MSLYKKILLGLGITFLVIQVIRIDKTNPVSDSEKDILKITNAPIEVGAVLVRACYNCHSNKSEYPWYTNLAPVSWWIKNHISEGREKLNFSEWGNYKPKKANHKMEECVEEVQEDEMPMSSYLLIHVEAKLSPNEKQLLLEWFSKVKKSYEEK